MKKKTKKESVKSFFGAFKGLGKFKREEFDRFETKWREKYKPKTYP